MWPGMRPATGWIAKLHVDAALGELVVELAHAVLRLRDGHAVAGHDDDARARSRAARPRPAAVALLTGFCLAAPAGPACTWPNAPNSTLVNERFIARHMMIERIRPDDPSSAPAMISSLFSSTKPIATADEAGVRVQQRDHGRHVGAADREDQQHAEEQREHDDDREQQPLRRVDHEHDGRRPARSPSSAEVDDVLAAVGDRPRRDHFLQLAGRHQAAGEGQEAEDHLERRSRPCGTASARRRCSQSMYFAVPTRPAARPPNACESAVRCGTAVSGTRESGTPIAVPIDDRDRRSTGS